MITEKDIGKFAVNKNGSLGQIIKFDYIRPGDIYPVCIEIERSIGRYDKGDTLWYTTDGVFEHSDECENSDVDFLATRDENPEYFL